MLRQVFKIEYFRENNYQVENLINELNRMIFELGKYETYQILQAANLLDEFLKNNIINPAIELQENIRIFGYEQAQMFLTSYQYWQANEEREFGPPKLY